MLATFSDDDKMNVDDAVEKIVKKFNEMHQNQQIMKTCEVVAPMSGEWVLATAVNVLFLTEQIVFGFQSVSL